MERTSMYSRIIAGTMTWGKWGKDFSVKEMISLMNHCLALGVTTFDHADIYGDYTNEDQFGNAFSKSGIKREDIQLISKCGIQFKAETRDNKVKHYDYGKDYIVWSVEKSLLKLRTEYLDMLLLHRPSPLMDPNEVLEAITRLKKEGKIRHFGVSNFTPSQIRLLETVVPVEGNQVEYSLTSNSVMYDGTLDDCMSNNRLAMSWSPLGVYFKENTEQTKRIKTVLHKLCDKYGVTEDQLLISWILRHPSKVYPVVGTTTPKRLESAIRSTMLQLELEDWFLLLEASNGHEVP